MWLDGGQKDSQWTTGCLTNRTQHNNNVVSVIPDFDEEGNLPPGVHWAEWTEVEVRLGGTPYRARLLAGFREGTELLLKANCPAIYLDGSFVTAKAFPGDFDACWSIKGVDSSRLDPIFLDFSNHRAAQKRRFMGEFFPAEAPEGVSGKTFLDFFQVDKETGKTKGIVALDLLRVFS